VKKLIAIALVVALVVTAIAVAIPTFASPNGDQVVFESDFIAVPMPGYDTFTDSEVRVLEGGDLKVEIDGAPAGRIYNVMMGCTLPINVRQYFPLGVMTEEDSGDYKLEMTLSSSSPPFLTIISAPDFVIYRSDLPPPYNPPQFTTGFYLP
jgi:hypothetical protein